MAPADSSSSRIVMEEAKSALRGIRIWNPVLTREGDPHPKTLAWQLQALCTSLDPNARFDHAVDGEGAIPASAQQAEIANWAPELIGSTSASSITIRATRDDGHSRETIVIDGAPAAEIYVPRLTTQVVCTSNR